MNRSKGALAAALFLAMASFVHARPWGRAKVAKPPRAAVPVLADMVLAVGASEGSTYAVVDITWPKALGQGRQVTLLGVDWGKSASTIFSLKEPLPNSWNGQTPLQVHFAFTAPPGSQAGGPVSKRSWQAEVIIYGYGYAASLKSTVEKKIILARGLLKGQMVATPRLACRLQRDTYVLTKRDPRVPVVYDCTNEGEGSVRLSAFQGDCGPGASDWVASVANFTSIPPKEKKTLVFAVSLPSQPFRDESCKVSFRANGVLQKLDSSPVHIRVSHSLFSFGLEDQYGKVDQNQDGTFRYAFDPTPPGRDRSVVLRLISSDAAKIQRVVVEPGLGPHFSIRQTEQPDRLRIVFAPKKDLESVNASATTRVFYENQVGALQTESLVLQLEGHAHVSKTVRLPELYHQAFQQKGGQREPCEEWFDEPARTKVEFDDWIGKDGLPSMWHSALEYRCWPWKAVTAGMRLKPPVEYAELSNYRLAAGSATDLERVVQPVAIQYIPRSLRFSVQAELYPAVHWARAIWPFQGDSWNAVPPLVGARLSGIYPLSRRNSYDMFNLGVEGVVASQPGAGGFSGFFQAELLGTLGGFVEIGSSLTRDRRVAVLLRTGMGWVHTERGYLQQRDTADEFFVYLGGVLQWRPTRLLPRLFVTISPQIGTWATNELNRFFVAVPVGVRLNF